MQQFLLNLYRNIFHKGSEMTLKDMVKEANEKVQEMMDLEKTFKIKASYISQDDGYLYDNEKKNE